MSKVIFEILVVVGFFSILAFGFNLWTDGGKDEFGEDGDGCVHSFGCILIILLLLALGISLLLGI